MKKKLVLGLGKSGLATARLLNEKKVYFYSFDQNIKSHIALNSYKFHTKIFTNVEELKAVLDDIDEVIVSPGISPHSKLIKAIESFNINLITEIDFALRYFNNTVVAITGTNGKSTLTQLVATILSKDSFIAAGNIGYAACEAVLEYPNSNLALELSSYQIEYMREVNISEISVFLSFATDHLERHGTLEEYFKIKWRLIENSVKNKKLAIISEQVYDDAIKFRLNVDMQNVLVITDKDVFPNIAFIKDNEIIVRRNKSTKSFTIPTGLAVSGDSLISAVIIYNELSSFDAETLSKCLQDFKGLPYRYQLHSIRDGFKIINDSKSTNVHSTMYAMRNTDGPIILFLGGIGKGESYLELLKFSDKIKTLICFGKDGEKISNELKILKTRTYKTLSDALIAEKELLKHPTGNILFSPACASFDEFKNFEDRGLYFSSSI